jgi:hypothetical protein
MIIKDEILKEGEHFISKHELSMRFDKYHNQFNKEIPFQIFLADKELEEIRISDDLLKSIHFHERISDENKEMISEESFKHFKRCIRQIDFGMSSNELLARHDNNVEAANQEFFDINTPIEAFEKLKRIEILIEERKDEDGVYYNTSNLQFDIPWEIEHGIVFYYKNRELVEIG